MRITLSGNGAQSCVARARKRRLPWSDEAENKASAKLFYSTTFALRRAEHRQLCEERTEKSIHPVKSEPPPEICAPACAQA
eukprot:3164267-Pleurochrysis_carterae.AAC.2